MIIFGDSGLSAREGRAGVLAPAALHAGERVQVVLPGQVRRPDRGRSVSEFSRSSGASAPVGSLRRKKRLTGPVNMWRYFECGT